MSDEEWTEVVHKPRGWGLKPAEIPPRRIMVTVRDHPKYPSHYKIAIANEVNSAPNYSKLLSKIWRRRSVNETASGGEETKNAAIVVRVTIPNSCSVRFLRSSSRGYKQLFHAIDQTTDKSIGKRRREERACSLLQVVLHSPQEWPMLAPWGSCGDSRPNIVLCTVESRRRRSQLSLPRLVSWPAGTWRCVSSSSLSIKQEHLHAGPEYLARKI